jgi:demethylmenaquinone methyltransferase / 2-methoxy-6-polyprenyl-1,4-benzoquinol methylase
MVTRRWNESDEAKAGYVRDLFTALAKRYNAMTDVWTLGLHRLWKRQAMQLLALELSKAMVEAGFVDARYTWLSTGFGTVHFRSRAAG